MNSVYSEHDQLEPEKLLQQEWLETNALGSYASSTLAGAHTRKYHGLLVAALPDKPDKYVIYANNEEHLIDPAGNSFPLSTHFYEPYVINPEGYRYLVRFYCDTHPIFVYQVQPDVVLIKELMMAEKSNTVLLRYTLYTEQEGWRIVVRPMLCWRHFHSVKKHAMYSQITTRSDGDTVYINCDQDELPVITFIKRHSSEFKAQPEWYFNVLYPQEIARGYEGLEDLYSPGYFESEFLHDRSVLLGASLDCSEISLEMMWAQTYKIKERRLSRISSSTFEGTLIKSALQFLVQDFRGHHYIQAGYPWFGVWGRDTFIALPGATLCTKRPAYALSVIKTFLKYEKNGLIPNMLDPNTDTVSYNSVDAGLWLVWSLQQYIQITQQVKPILGFWPQLKQMFMALARGTDNDIGMLENGLLTAGNAATQLTWMDACVHGRPVTPRHGLAVEINALWFNMVSFMLKMAVYLKDEEIMRFQSLKDRIKQSFRDTFWMPEADYLGDCLSDGVLNKQIRPNQLFAVSLPYSPLTYAMAHAVVETVSHHLLTPYGLRTLSPDDPAFKGRYEGGPDERDDAYHNGTVWPWLMGHFGEAVLKVSKDKDAAISQLETILQNMESMLGHAGYGSISEIYDGDGAPNARGCIAQAWSVAEILRLYQLVETEKKGGNV